MSGYRDDDFDRRDDRDRDDRRDDAEDIRIAKSKVLAPAIGLIVVAALGLLSVASGLIQYPGLDAAFDEQIQEIEDNPQFTDDQKKEQVKMWNQIRDGVKVGWLPFYCSIGLIAVVIFAGALMLMNLRSPTLVYFSAVLSFIPCTSGCCFLGLIFGIWALIAMGNPDVKAGFAARRRAAYSPDTY